MNAITKILCAVDDTEHSQPAVALAGSLAGKFGAELTIVAVNEQIGGYSRAGPPASLWMDSQLQKIFADAVAGAQSAGASKIKTLSIESRDIARAIASYAESNGYEHIVVGSGGKGAVSRLVLGSVSRDVVSRAHCPVTVAR